MLGNISPCFHYKNRNKASSQDQERKLTSKKAMPIKIYFSGNCDSFPFDDDFLMSPLTMNRNKIAITYRNTSLMEKREYTNPINSIIAIIPIKLNGIIVGLKGMLFICTLP